MGCGQAAPGVTRIGLWLDISDRMPAQTVEEIISRLDGADP